MKHFIAVAKILLAILPLVLFMTHFNMKMEQQRFKPHIYTVSGGKVLVAKISGDPDLTMDSAGTALYNGSRRLKLSPSYMSGRHMDWRQRHTLPRQQWIIHYSRMVPETATALGNMSSSTSVEMYFERRRETEVAEILHLGRYEDIPHSLTILQQFVRRQGYRLSGFYEEVYLVFEHIEPDPAKYETLLRYQVTKL